MKIAFTICSNNYLAQAISLGETISKYASDYKFYIGLADKPDQTIDYKSIKNCKVIFYDQIGFEIFNEMVERYNIVEFNTAVKPFYFDYFFLQNGENARVIYIDPDILLHNNLCEIDNLLIDNDIILTPHILTAHPEQSQFEKLILNVGVFNLGFLALKNTINTRILLKWWEERLKFDCRIAFCEGLFVDQIWANYIPCLFKNVHILKHLGFNMGYWNFTERSINLKQGTYYVNNEYQLVLFHYSNFNPLNPNELCKWLKYSFNERPDLKDLYKEYTSTLIRNNYEQFSKLPRGLKFLENHPVVDKKIETKRKKVGKIIKVISDKIIKIIFKI